jgi:mRNA interferase MazF
MTAPSSRVPQRGEVWWLELNPALGHEQARRRPVVVLSLGDYNRRLGMMICCPVTSSVKGYPFEVALPQGLAVSGVALADQIKSVDWKQRSPQFITQLTSATTHEILRRARTMLSET